MPSIAWQDLIGTSFLEIYTLRNLVYARPYQAEFLGVAQQDPERLVSIVFLEPGPDQFEQELAAIRRARQLQHPNLLHVIDGGEYELAGTKVVFVATELAQGTLAEALVVTPRPDPRQVLDDLLPALEWLHSQNLVYRSLDPETIVRANSRWKLAELGQLHAAGQFDPSEATGPNAPPEAAAGWILPAWDSWSIGVLLRQMLAGEPGTAHAPFNNILRGCLEPDYGQRLGLDRIRILLRPVVPVESAAEPRLQARAAEPGRQRWRVPAAALAVLAILLALLFLRLGSRHQSAPAPVAARLATPPVAERISSTPPAKVPPPAAPPSSPPAPKKAPVGGQQIGRAGYFSDDLQGHLTATGETFSNQGMTAASRQFPLGTRVRVTNLKNGKSVILRVNDRGAGHGTIVTVTRRAAEVLGFLKAGWTRVKVELAK